MTDNLDYKAFLSAVEAVKEVVGRVGIARDLPKRAGRRVDSLSFQSYNRGYDAQEDLYAAELTKRYRAEKISLAEAERDNQLLAISAELENLRAVLPQIAAKAAIALGELARDLRREVTETT